MTIHVDTAHAGRCKNGIDDRIVLGGRDSWFVKTGLMVNIIRK
jgi:hypothetical protein